MPLQIKCLDKFRPLIEQPKRTKIIVGGRGSTKSTFAADYVSACMSAGQLWCCAREFQNSIDESVHRLLSDEIDRLALGGFHIGKTEITHSSGGRAFYRGLARNILSLKGILSGVDGLWIEEGEGLSDATLRVLTGSVRLTAKDYDLAIADGLFKGLSMDEALASIKQPEIWITMNRGSREDPIAKKYLARAESALESCGFYEDDAIMVVEANYYDMPKSWFVASGLEQERLDDKENMDEQEYESKWHGKYYETVENPLIRQKWFDACIDAHLKLGFEPTGREVLSFDPSDMGLDPAAYTYRHGSVYLEAEEKTKGDIFEKCDWALDKAIELKVDDFVFDGDGMGGTLRERVANKLKGKKIDWMMFKGSEGPEDPEALYQDYRGGKDDKPRKNKDVFSNQRSQKYVDLASRVYKTWEAVEKGKYHDPDKLISFSSGIKVINKIRSELCRLPLKSNGNGKIQLMTKKELKALGIPSPNIGDSAMMSLKQPKLETEYEPIRVAGW